MPSCLTLGVATLEKALFLMSPTLLHLKSIRGLIVIPQSARQRVPLILVVVVAYTVSGCSPFGPSGPILIAMVPMSGSPTPDSFGNYGSEPRHVASLRSLRHTISLGQFTGTQDRVWCRLERLSVSPKHGGTFASYIWNAFADAIVMADVARSTPPTEAAVELTGTLKDIDVNCGIISGSWTIEMVLTLGGQPPFSVRTVRAFESEFFSAGSVGRRAYEAFAPSVQEFVNDVLISPSFQSASDSAIRERGQD